MNETKLILIVAAACSTVAVLACLLIVPQLYTVINQIHDEVIDNVALFRVSTVWQSP